MIKVTTIKKLMAVRGINSSELARRTGLNRSSISRILNGKLNPQQDTLKRIADELGVSPLELLEEEHSVFTKPNGVTMKYIAIFDDNFFDDDELTIIALDKNGVMHKIPLKPLQRPVLTFPDGQNLYLTQEHIDALLEYEKQVSIAEAVKRINEGIQEAVQLSGKQPDIDPIVVGKGCAKCPSHVRCFDAFQIHSYKCNHYNKTEEEFKAWLKGEKENKE